MEMIALLLAPAALAWGATYLMRGSLHLGCVIYIIAAGCFGYPFWSANLGPIPLTTDRLVLPALLGAFAFQWWSRRLEPKPMGNADAVLLCLLAWLATSTFTHEWRATRPGDVAPLWRLLAGYLIPSLIYFLVRQSRLDERSLRQTYWALGLFGAYLAITGVFEVTRQWQFVFPKHIADPDLGLHFGRARGPMVQSVSYGLCVTLCMLAAWNLRAGQNWWRERLITLLAPIHLVGAYLSYTRSVWLGAGIALVLVCGMTLRGVFRNLVIVSAVLGGVAVVAVKYDSIVEIKREEAFSAKESGDSARSRAIFTYVSWLMFQDRPLTGVGFGHFPEAKLPYLSDRSTSLQLEIIRENFHHNTFLSLLTETGLPGMALFIALLGTWARQGYLLWRDPKSSSLARSQGACMLGVLCAHICQLMFHELSYNPLDHSLVFFFAGITVGLRQTGAPAWSISWPRGALAPASG